MSHAEAFPFGFSEFLEMRSNESLASLLKPRYEGRTGPERRVDLGDGVVDHVDPYGSHRLVFSEDGEPVSAIQVIVMNGKRAILANAFTAPSHRRRGIASLLVRKARELFPSITASEDRSEDGAAFAASNGF